MGYRGREENSGGLSAECRGWELRDREGEKIGKVEEVFVNDEDRPEYLGVKTGLLGGKLTLLPADIVRADDEARLIEVSASRDHVKDAPSLGSNEEITAERERGVRDHFGLDSGSSGDDRREQDGEMSEDSHVSDRNTAPDDERRTGTDGTTGDRESWTDSGDSSTEASTNSSTDSPESTPAAATGDTATGYGGRDREDSRDTGGRPGTEGGQETMRVSVWREKTRAEKVLGDDGNEEVRVRKQWVEEEEIVEVEDRRQG